MKWALTQGLLHSARASLLPSPQGMGPNTYLTRNDFFKMMGAALAVHVLVIGIASLFPSEKVTNIPVRALSFKLGDNDRVAAFRPGATERGVSAPVMQASQTETRIVAKPAPQPVKQTPPRPQPDLRKTAPIMVPTPPPSPAAPAIAAQPQQYVREVGGPRSSYYLADTFGAGGAGPASTQFTGNAQGAVGGTGAENTQTEQTTREIRDRYEQQISGWIQRHKLYPAEANGQAGRVVIRMRIDRGGAVRYYAIEESSGIRVIDAAALDMIRRANPVPAAPANYPAGSLIEFLIPITFRAP